MGSLTAPVLAGLIVGVGFVLLFSLFSSIIHCNRGDVQLQVPNNDRLVKFSKMIVYGTVINAKIQPYIRDADGWDVRTVVTIQTDRFLLDKTDKHPPFIIYYDTLARGCASVFKSYPNMNHPLTVTYKVGERSLFFIHEHLGSWHATGAFAKFDIVEDGTKLQSKWRSDVDHRDYLEPVPISTFEAEIQSLIEKYHNN